MTWKNPIDTPTDTAKLGGVVTPGICEIVGASSPRNYEELGGAGWSGGLLAFRGIKLSHFSIYLYLYESEDWDQWAKLRPLVAKPPFGKRPTALDVVHPILNEIGIASLVIEDQRAPTQTDPGVWLIELQCIESRKLRPGSATVSGSDATPVDPRDDKIDKLLKKLDELRAKRLGAEGNLPK